MDAVRLATLIGLIVGGCASVAPPEGRWVLAESPHPETVSIRIAGKVIEFGHRCTRVGGRFRLEDQRLVLADEIVTEGRCRNDWDVTAEADFRELTRNGFDGLTLDLRRGQLLLSDASGKTLRFRRVSPRDE